jgi:excisionase family DNA binding protein
MTTQTRNEPLRTALREIREIATRALAELDRQETDGRESETRAIPFTLESLAERWGCSANYVRNLIVKGNLPAFKVGGRLFRISAAAVEKFETSGGSR